MRNSPASPCGASISSFGLTQIELPGYYITAGFKLSEQFELNLHYEDSTSQVDLGFLTGEAPFFEDAAISLIYRFSPYALLRLELHHATPGTLADEPIMDLFAAGPDTDYGILSLSVSY